MAGPIRFVVIGQPQLSQVSWPEGLEFVPVTDSTAAADLVRAGGYAGLFADPSVVTEIEDRYRRDELILAHVEEGIALLNPEGRVIWTNPAFKSWCEQEPVGQTLINALDRPIIDCTDPIYLARQGNTIGFNAHRPASFEQPHLHIRLRPVSNPDKIVTHLLAHVRNITMEVEQRQKLDALHQAGRGLADIDAAQLALMDVDTRVDFLRRNVRNSIYDLLKYDTMEVRILDQKTKELKPLLEEGMTTEAASRKLYAKASGNGVTGYVAFHKKSYLCRDTATDKIYIRGAMGARSSMTVPLIYNDEVIGTLNVESPRPNAFSDEDLQFTELFSREIAAALHQLELLQAQRECAATASIEAVNKEIALPVDDILTAAATLYVRLHGMDEDAGANLRKVMAAARAIKESVRKVGVDLAPVEPAPPGDTALIAAPDAPDEQYPLKGKSVLVVDSDERLRRQAHLVVGRLGAHVETAGNATEGLALSLDAPYDAVLLDLRPPDMGGYEAYKRFRAALPHAQICLTTGYGYDVAHSIVKARQDGMQFVLFKPFREDQITKAVLTPVSHVQPVG